MVRAACLRRCPILCGQPSLFATCCHCQRRWRGSPPERSPRGLRRTTPHLKSPPVTAVGCRLGFGPLALGPRCGGEKQEKEMNPYKPRPPLPNSLLEAARKPILEPVPSIENAHFCSPPLPHRPFLQPARIPGPLRELLPEPIPELLLFPPLPTKLLTRTCV